MCRAGVRKRLPTVRFGQERFLSISGANMKDKYYLNGIENAVCTDGIGTDNSIFVYSFGNFMYCPFQAYFHHNMLCKRI